MIFSALLATFVAAGPAHASFNFNDLKTLTQQTTSIEETLKKLPAEMRGNYVLMHRSRSIQGASPENPRALLFNDDATLVMAFTNDPRGADHFEIMTFDPKDSRFDVKTIAFANGRASVNESPQNCFGCHGRMDGDLRPAWDPGLVWRGAYGSHNDTFTDPATIDEAQAYAKFITQTPPVYRALDLSRKVGAGDRHLIENRPNLRLGLLLMRQEAKRVARLMGPGHLKDLCTPVPGPWSAEVNSNLELFLPKLYDVSFTKDFIANEAASIAETLAAVDKAGVDVDEVPLTKEKRTSAVFDGSVPFKDLLFAELARREVETPLTTISLTESRLNLKTSAALRAIDSVGATLTEASTREICAGLRTTSR